MGIDHDDLDLGAAEVDSDAMLGHGSNMPFAGLRLKPVLPKQVTIRMLPG
jgi:sortase (surface protein transpeptidase)